MLIEDVAARDYRGLTIAPPPNVRDDDGNGPHSCQLRHCTGVRLFDPHVLRDDNTEMGIGVNDSIKCSIIRPVISGGNPTRESADAITIDAGSVGCKVDLNGGRIDCKFRAVCFADGTGHYLMLGPNTVIRSPLDQPIAIDGYYQRPVSVTVVGASAAQRKLIYVKPGCKVTYVDHL
jgi:hypothetical protein